MRPSAVEVDYEVLEAVVDGAKALEGRRAAAPPGGRGNLCFDWSSATRPRRRRPSAKAAHITRLDIVNNRLVPNAMEPRAALGHYDPADDHYTVGRRRRTRMSRAS